MLDSHRPNYEFRYALEFLPASSLLTDGYEEKSIALEQRPNLPDGDYSFIDFYCTNRNCDCRKTIIHVLHQGRHVSTVNYGWESPEFYCRWMKAGMDDSMAKEMSGLSIDFASPDRLSPQAILDLMQQLLDDSWISTLKDHYKRIRQSQRSLSMGCHPSLPKAPARNAPCPCGSGKKFKHCCLRG